MSVVFIYKHKSKIHVLDHEFHTIGGKTPKGWELLHTLDATLFINNLFTLSQKELIKEIKSLKTKKQ